jgi:hypothetical protein
MRHPQVRVGMPRPRQRNVMTIPFRRKAKGMRRPQNRIGMPRQRPLDVKSNRQNPALGTRHYLNEDPAARRFEEANHQPQNPQPQCDEPSDKGHFWVRSK